MWKTLLVAIAIVALMPQVGACQDAKTALEGVAKAMGGTDLKSIQYSGSGSTFAPGQNPNPTAPWPRFNAKSYTRYDQLRHRVDAGRDSFVRRRNNPRAAVAGNP